MLDLVDEAFDQVSFTIQMPVILTLLSAIRAQWNHGFDATLFDGLNQLIRVIALVSNHGVRFEVFDQPPGVWAVMAFAAR